MDIKEQQQSLLTFRVGPVLCCAPSLPVRTIITPPKLTHPPGSDTSQPGIFKHGSHIVKVIDLRQKFGVDLAEQTQPGNLIITVFENESFAFWVDQILDVFNFPSVGWGNLPAAIPRGVFSRTLLLNKKIHLYSEFEKLSSINDLGYLEHYIQQLKQQVTDQAIKPTTSHQEQKKVTSETTTTVAAVTPVPEIKIAEKKDSAISTITATPSINIKPVSTAKQSLPHTSIPKKVEKQPRVITEVQRFNKPLIKKEVIRHKTTRPTTVATTTGIQQPIKSNKTYKAPSHFENRTDENSFSSQITPPVESHSNEKSESNFGVIFFFIFIVGALSSGIYYLFFEGDGVKGYHDKEGGLLNSTKLNNSVTENYKSEVDSIPDYTTPTTDDMNITSETIVEKSITDNLTQNELSNSTSYQADITQLDNEITITIHEPVSSSQPQQVEKPIIQKPSIEKEIQNETVVDTPPVKALKPDELNTTIKPEKIINEVVHTVVKGDTLWAIAKKYVNNPFLYPELARLSKIKNPHRIYPGNRVRIRFIKK